MIAFGVSLKSENWFSHGTPMWLLRWLWDKCVLPIEDWIILKIVNYVLWAIHILWLYVSSSVKNIQCSHPIMNKGTCRTECDQHFYVVIKWQ